MVFLKISKKELEMTLGNFPECYFCFVSEVIEAI